MNEVIKVLKENRYIDTAYSEKSGYITVIPYEGMDFLYLGEPLKDFEVDDENADYLIAGKYYKFKGASNLNTIIYEIAIKEVEI